MNCSCHEQVCLSRWSNIDRKSFSDKKQEITTALNGNTGIISGVNQQTYLDIFYMLLFCLCVPQSRAVLSQKAVDLLRSARFHDVDLKETEVETILRKLVRFQSTKANRLIEAKRVFFTTSFWTLLCEYYNDNCVNNCVNSNEQKMQILYDCRVFLIYTISGMGFKVASHFMRNIGMHGLAILDVHILDGLKKRCVISDVKLTPKNYQNIEQKMLQYSSFVGLSVDQLDLLLWSEKTGFVFK